MALLCFKVHVLGFFAFALLVIAVSERRCVWRNDRGTSMQSDIPNEHIFQFLPNWYPK